MRRRSEGAEKEVATLGQQVKAGERDLATCRSARDKAEADLRGAQGELVTCREAADRAKPAAKSAGGYVVQVAALNDADKAKQMQEQMAAAGVKSYTEVVPIVKGRVTRVRAGPFASRDEAEKIRDQLKRMGLNGNVVAK